MIKTHLALLFPLALCACVTTSFTDAGRHVRVTSNPETVRGCVYQANVEGADHMNGGLLGSAAANENAMRRMVNRAAELGADTVMMATSTTAFSGAILRGEAYRCNHQPIPTAIAR